MDKFNIFTYIIFVRHSLWQVVDLVVYLYINSMLKLEYFINFVNLYELYIIIDVIYSFIVNFGRLMLMLEFDC